MIQDLQVVDVAFTSLRKSESRAGTFHQISPLNTCKVSGGIVIRSLEPVVAVAILPGGDAAPADDTRVEVALVEEELTGGGTEVRALEIARITTGIETVGFLLDGLRVGILGEDDVTIVGEPLAGFDERELQVVHDKVDRASVGVAHVAFVGVLADVEVEAGVPVVVKGAQGHMTRGPEAKPLSNSLNGECSELFKIKFIYHSSSRI